MNYGPRFRSSGYDAVPRFVVTPIPFAWNPNNQSPLRVALNRGASEATKNNKKRPPTVFGPDMRIKKQENERLKAERRMLERLQKAVEILVFGIEELSQGSIEDDRRPDPAHHRHNRKRELHVSTDRLMELTRMLAKAANMDEPEFTGVYRKPGQRPYVKRCINCGFQHQELSSHCLQCEEIRKNTRLAELAAEARARAAQNVEIARDIKAISKAFRDTQRKLAEQRKEQK